MKRSVGCGKLDLQPGDIPGGAPAVHYSDMHVPYLLDQRLDTSHQARRGCGFFAARHPDTPWMVRVLAALVAAYALSPIDLIPDFIPVLGYLDDLLLVPAGLALVLWLLPPHVLEESREKAQTLLERPRSSAAAMAIVAIWLLCAVAAGYWWWSK